MSDPGVEARLAALEAKVVNLQDQLDVLRVVASYAPYVDGGAVAESGQFWTEDCLYDSDGELLQGRGAIEALSERVGTLPMGVAHNLNLPIIVVDGDTAVVTGESNTFVKVDDLYVVHRVSANRWELVKVDGRWQVKHRVNRLLDGTAEPRELLSRGIRESLA